MAQVQMQVYRGTSDYLDTISNVDGQFLYDEDTHQILVDNGTTREQYGGGNEKVYDTYAEAVADLANIADGQTVFVKEGSSNELAQRVNDLETDLGDKATASAVSGDNAFAKINTLNTHLSDKADKSYVDGLVKTDVQTLTFTNGSRNYVTPYDASRIISVMGSGSLVVDGSVQGNNSIYLYVDNNTSYSGNITVKIRYI